MLADSLEDRVARGLVSRRSAKDAPHLSTYCYTQRTVIDGAWDWYTMVARGIVLDHAERVVRALPFPKFFNMGERGAPAPECRFWTEEKMDGSLGIVFHDGTRWRCATKGSLDSEQAAWASARLPVSGMEVGNTYLFEIIYDANRIVVPYDFEGLVLLSAYAQNGTELHPEECDEVADAMGVRRPARATFETLADMLREVEGFKADREGYVVRFEDGTRLKVKGAEYLRVHRLVSRVTPLGVWDVLSSGDNPDAVMGQLPDEFHGDFRAIRAALEASHDAATASVSSACAKYADASDKDVGLILSTLDPVAQKFIFRARRNPQWMDDAKTREHLWRLLRPTGNVLDGYKPSRLLARVADAE
jgi:RNA ligase